MQKPSATLADQLDLPKGKGLVIESVSPNSAAAKAGLKKHDILLEFNNKPVPSDVAEFVKMVNEVRANKPVDAVVLRRGNKETIKGLSLPEGKNTQPFQFHAGHGVQPFQFHVAPPGGQFNWTPPNVQFHGFGASGERGVFTTMFRTKDSFNTRYQEGSLIITVTGSVTEGRGRVKQIQIQDAGKSETYESLDKVPEQYRDKVKNLIEMSEKNNLKIEVGDQKKERLNYHREQGNSGAVNIDQVVINLEHGDAAALAEALKLLIPLRRSNPVEIVIPGRPLEKRPPSKQGNSDLPASAKYPIFLSAAGTKLVASSADPDGLKLVSELYRLMQIPSGEGDYEIIKLEYARAADGARALAQAFGSGKPYSTFGLREEPRIRVVPDSTTNSLLVQANPLDRILVRAFVKEKIDRKNPGSRH